MTHKAYRRLVRGLFLGLLLLFFLLYLLLNGRENASPTQQGGGWRDGGRNMGIVTLSEIRSGGFILDELPIPVSTTLTSGSFDVNTVTCRAELRNESSQTVKVAMSIHGTDLSDGKAPPPGLCGSFYYYGGEKDPLGTRYRAFLTERPEEFTVSTHDQKNMVLYENSARYPLKFTIPPGETIHLRLFFWTDEAVMPYVTDVERSAFSVTVKLISRAA